MKTYEVAQEYEIVELEIGFEIGFEKKDKV